MKNVIDWIRNIDMRWVMGIIGLMTVIEQAIIGGHTPLSDPGSPISPAVLARIVWWCSFAVWVNGFVLMGHAGTAATWVTSSPTVAKVVAIFAVMLAAMMFDGGTSLAFAQSTRSAPKTAPAVETPSDCLPLDPRPACKNGVFSPNAPIPITPSNSTASLSALWAKIIDKDLPTDLTYAKALADNAATPGSKLRSACYAALLTANQQANGSGLTSGSAPLTEPPAPANVFSELEKAAQVIDNLQPTSPVVSGCAPAAQVLKMDVLNFISTVVSGAAIKTLTAGVLP